MDHLQRQNDILSPRFYSYTLWILQHMTHLQPACREPPYGLTVNVCEMTDHQMLQIRWESVAGKHS